MVPRFALPHARNHELRQRQWREKIQFKQLREHPAIGALQAGE